MQTWLFLVAFLADVVEIQTASHPLPLCRAPVVPIPQNCNKTGSTVVALTSTWSIAANLSDSDAAFAAIHLQQVLMNGTSGGAPSSIRMSIVHTSTLHKNSTRFIAIGSPATDANLLPLASSHGATHTAAELAKPDGYIFTVAAASSSIFIVGGAAEGAFYG